MSRLTDTLDAGHIELSIGGVKWHIKKMNDRYILAKSVTNIIGKSELVCQELKAVLYYIAKYHRMPLKKVKEQYVSVKESV